MTTEVIISAEKLGKKYLIAHQGKRERYRSLRDSIARSAVGFGRSAVDRVNGQWRASRSSTEEFWALRDVSFEIRRGEVVGVIGRNGAGKSTLLKLLSRITEPSEGRVTIRGRVASLLEVGTGFHPELTGRENIYLNGAILGMTRSEIRRKFDEIVAFADVERFLDIPVKRYSSGMSVRLAFAVAAHLEPEILVVDEVLAVGDAEFQRKCLGKMHSVSGGGRTVIFVSHNMQAVQALCSNAIVLENGSIVGYNETSEAIKWYLSTMNSTPLEGKNIQLFEGLWLERFDLSDVSVQAGEQLSVTISLTATVPMRVHHLHILIYASSGVRVAIVDLRQRDRVITIDTKNRLTIDCLIKRLNLVEGHYRLGLYVSTSELWRNLDDIVGFDVTNNLSEPIHVKLPKEYRGYVEFASTAEFSVTN